MAGHKPVAVAVVCEDGLQEYVNGGVPPVPVTAILPLQALLQVTLVREETEIVGPEAFTTTAVFVIVQPDASVTVQV